MAKKLETTIVLGGKVASSLQKAFKKSEDGIDALNKAYDKMSEVGTKAFKTIATAAAATATAILATTEATRDYRKDLAKLESNAELAGISNEEMWGSLENIYAMSGEFDSANEALSNLLATGYKGKDLEKVIEAVNGATVKWQDTISQEGLSEAINESVMSGKATGQFAEIVERSGKNIEGFNEGLLNCNGLAERQQYVLSWLAKSGLTEVNAAYQENNKELVEAYKADLAFQDSLANIAKVAEPVVSVLKRVGADALTKIADKLATIDIDKFSNSLSRAAELGGQAFELLWQVLESIDWETVISAGTTILDIFVKIFGFVVNNWGAISPIIYGIVGAMVAYKAIMLVANTLTAISNGLKIAGSIASALLAGKTLIQAGAAGAATAAQLGLNAAFLASPITWVVLGIAALVAAFVTLWKKCEGFREFWKNLWDGIKEVVAKVWDWLKGVFDAIGDFFDSVGDWIKNLFGGGKKTLQIDANVSESGKKAAKNALGSTITRPTLTWVGEGGDVETIVPHNNKPRSQALALRAVQATGATVGGSTFVFSPVYNINGGDTSTIRGILADAQAEFEARCDEWERNKRRVAF